MDELIKKLIFLIEEIKKNSNKKTFRKNIIDNKEVKDMFFTLYGELPMDKSLSLFLSKIYYIPICENTNCSNIVNISNTGPGKYCSKKCSSKHQYSLNIDKREKTNLEKYGVKNPLSNKDISNKRIETLTKKYGRGVSDKTYSKIMDRVDNFILKSKETIKKKYGVDNSILIPGIIDKRKKSNLEKYGTNNFSRKENPKDLLKIPGIEILKVEEPKVDDKKIYPHKNSVIKFKCDCGNIESHPYQTYKYRIRNFNTPCSVCANIEENVSNKEKELLEFLFLYNKNIETNNRNIIPPKEIDIFLKDINLAIEFNGIFWHTEEKGKDQNYHLNKTISCKNNNINLIHIFEDEWNTKKDIVKSRLKSKLGINNKIYARNTKVEIISSSESKLFCDNNHIQGGVYSNINLALKYNNDIVAVMTFSKPNITRGKSKNNYDYELVRFCNKLDTNVVGGASKLFKYFIKNYKPTSILSYSDNRWGSGKLYDILGFDFVSNTKPNYWYVKNNIRHHRYQFTKHKLVNMGHDKNKSEKEIMKELGYGRIWDCGHAKWVWQK